MAEDFEVLATENSQVQEADVKLGEQYRLTTRSQFTAVCDAPGCDSQQRPGQEMEDAILIVQLIAESGRAGPPITILGNATFRSPISGKLRFVDFAEPPIQPEQLEKLKEQCEKLQIKTRELRFFEAVPVP